ncbi:MAG TPA: DEAD/DEAH box helicase, partial [Gammaproteobacteria bacterium]|nr:DEAD/DEAH box helicase [Gammaproteobacteria bacterium]
RIAEVADWHLDLEEQPDNHWFDLDLGIEVDGERVPLLPILLDAFEHFTPEMRAQLREADEEHKTLYTLEDGRILPLPTRRVARILDVLVELFDRDGGLEKDGRLRLSEWRAAELADLTRREPELHWRGGERLRSLAERLQAFDRIEPMAPPAGFRAELRHYQQEGLGWLQFLREAELHGILADDMGLGKTVQALAHILAEKRAGRLDRPALVVAPTSLMHNWRQEAKHFAPELSVLTLHGTGRKQHYDRIADHDVVLTTYPLLPRDEEILLGHTFHILILDEAQQIKNPKAKAAQVARRLDARQRICLTGTPLENHLGELWSLFHFLMPGLLGDERQFRRLFRNPIEKHGDAERAERLARRVAPFMLRRTKEQVATELPPKTEIVHSVPLTGTQRDLYESIRLTLHGKVREAIARQGLKRSHIVVLDALLKLRQICCDPRLLKIDAARKVRRSAKLELLMELLPELLDEGRRILLFSQFTTMLGLIEDELKARGIEYVKLTGKTRNRATPIERFQNGEVPLFLISLKAGGTGLNLTAADTVIHYDPWWNPAVENQATDRAHRIGQDKPVFVYKLLTEGTVEERIQEMQARKRKLADNLFAGADHGKLPGAEEIAELFGPLE